MLKTMKMLWVAALVSLNVWAVDASASNAFPQGSSWEVGYSPDGSALNLVIKVIDSARAQIMLAAYSFSSKPVAEALVRAQKRGVKVYVLADEKSNQAGYSAVTFVANNGIPTRLNGHYPIMHNKYIIVDNITVENGSFNYSAAAANKNAENALVIWNAPEFAARYITDWKRLWEEGTELKPNY